jgi:rsbT co-antagonist protein RsbR
LARAEQQAKRLTQSADELAEQIAQQRRLLDLVATLETPAVTLAEGVLLAPLVGHLDSRRAEALARRLLQAAGERRAQLVVIDITGVAAVDTSVAQALLSAAQALRLLGCRVTITGISPTVATTLTDLGTRLDGIVTARTPQDALAEYASEGREIRE